MSKTGIDVYKHVSVVPNSILLHTIRLSLVGSLVCADLEMSMPFVGARKMR